MTSKNVQLNDDPADKPSPAVRKKARILGYHPKRQLSEPAIVCQLPRKVLCYVIGNANSRQLEFELFDTVNSGRRDQEAYFFGSKRTGDH